MDPEIASKLREEFAEGEQWGWNSLWADHSVFWSNDHERLTELTDREIAVSLAWQHHYANQWGQKPRLYFDEKKLWKRHFEIIAKAAAVLLFFLVYNYFNDEDHDTVIDIFEGLLPVACERAVPQDCKFFCKYFFSWKL